MTDKYNDIFFNWYKQKELLYTIPYLFILHFRRKKMYRPIGFCDGVWYVIIAKFIHFQLLLLFFLHTIPYDWYVSIQGYSYFFFGCLIDFIKSNAAWKCWRCGVIFTKQIRITHATSFQFQSFWDEVHWDLVSITDIPCHRMNGKH